MSSYWGIVDFPEDFVSFVYVIGQKDLVDCESLKVLKQVIGQKYTFLSFHPLFKV